MSRHYYHPIIRDHLSKLLVGLPTVGPEETQLFLDNIDYLLNINNFISEHIWHSNDTFPASAPVFDVNNPADFGKVTIEIEDMSLSNPGAEVEGYRGQLCVDGRIMAKGRSMAKEADALKELYEAMNDIAEGFGGGRRWYKLGNSLLKNERLG